jgi:hypothetical protein
MAAGVSVKPIGGYGLRKLSTGIIRAAEIGTFLGSAGCYPAAFGSPANALCAKRNGKPRTGFLPDRQAADLCRLVVCAPKTNCVPVERRFRIIGRVLLAARLFGRDRSKVRRKLIRGKRFNIHFH